MHGTKDTVIYVGENTTLKNEFEAPAGPCSGNIGFGKQCDRFLDDLATMNVGERLTFLRRNLSYWIHGAGSVASVSRMSTDASSLA